MCSFLCIRSAAVRGFYCANMLISNKFIVKPKKVSFIDSKFCLDAVKSIASQRNRLLCCFESQLYKLAKNGRTEETFDSPRKGG